MTKSLLHFQNERRLVPSALNFACFLIDGGWYVSAEKILRKIESLQNVVDIMETEVRAKLLHVLGAYSKFPEAEIVFRQLLASVSPWNDVQCEMEEEAGCRQRLRSVSTSSSSCMLTDDDDSEASSVALSRTTILDG